MSVESLQQTAPSNASEAPARGDRVARTREAIVGSTLSLALEGEVAPIVRDIAKLAGVSARTVFQHFADTAELYVAVLGRVITKMTAGSPDINRQWPLDQRITVVVGHRAARYEEVRPMWTFIQTLQRRSAEAAERILKIYKGSRDELADSFGPELSRLSDDKRENTLNALSMALSPESWIMLRERLGLTVDQARDEWRFVVGQIFDHEPRR